MRVALPYRPDASFGRFLTSRVRCRRLDSLVGLFAVGKAPSASADPFGLRRAAYGLVQTLVENGVPLALPAALRLAAEQQPLAVSEAALAEVDTFVTRRLEQFLVSTRAVPPGCGWRLVYET